MAKRKDPIFSFRFLVEIDGLVHGGFQEIAGISIEVDMESKKEGGLNEFEHHFIKGIKNSNLTLKRGMGVNKDLWKWFQKTCNAKPEEKNGSIHIQDTTGKTISTINFFNAFPIKWEGPALNAQSSGIAIESITLVHQGLDLVK